MTDHDIVINGGTVVDGTGTPGRRLSVGVTGGRISALSPGRLTGRREIDATGQTVTPGFIDLHSHADFAVEPDPGADTQITQGVTTLVTGNCGHSPFPLDADGTRPRSGVLDGSALSWTWRDAAGFGEAMTRVAPAVNLALQVGHNAIRLAVLGMDDRPPNEDELRRMCDLVTQAARQGAVGFSTGLIYMPGVFASPEEVRALVAAAASAGLLYSTHIRNETFHVIDAVREAIGAAEAGGARLEISHLKAMGPENHGAVTEALALIDAARERGVDVTADVYPYTASSTGLVSRLPAWAVDGGVEPTLARLADPPVREKIAAELRARFGRDIDPEGVVIAALPEGRYSGSVGRSLADIGRAEGTDPAEAALRVLEHHRLGVGIVNHAMSEADVETVLRHPWVSVASDGWVMTAERTGRPHPRSFGTFSRVLGRYVRERGVLPLEEAVRRMTSLPAARIRAADRGVLRVGAAADIAVFDAATVTDRATYEEPWQLSTGFSTVLVNGVAALLDGALTPHRAGRVITPSPAAAS
ncbi:D-aminoacylase [Streptomyces sp. RFCAC02]|uniref:N-acyl-D-amino-acid deacylase family protein n=1 Tax=Streptomyces sp. RFCAC02 TaxID=2499143 RepID=UPI0010203AAF|nr:D-aminoacylase [Streptomyces sp. RFCAC02]